MGLENQNVLCTHFELFRMHQRNINDNINAALLQSIKAPFVKYL